MLDPLKKLIGIETKTEKERKAWQSRMQAWQSRFEFDASVYPHEEATLSGHSGGVNALTLLSNGYLASGGYKEIKHWNVLSGVCERTLLGHNDKVSALTLLWDGRLVSVGNGEDVIKIRNVLSGLCEQRLLGHGYSLALLSDGRLASGGGETIKLWNVLSGSCERTLSGHSGGVFALALLSDGRLASGSSDKKVKLWNVSSGLCEMTLSGHGDSVCALTLLLDGRLASGSSDKKIKLWNVLSGFCEMKLSGHGSGVYALALLPDGRLASGSYQEIKLWNVLSGSCETTLLGHSDSVNALTLLLDGRLASGSDDKTVKLWNVGLKLASSAAIKVGQNMREPIAATQLDNHTIRTIEDQKIQVTQPDMTTDFALSVVEPMKQISIVSAPSQAKTPPHHEAKNEMQKPKTPTLEKLLTTISPRPVSAKSNRTTTELTSHASQVGPLPNIHSKTPRATEFALLSNQLIAEDKVRIGRELGKGGYGTVYEAQYNFQTVAVKRYEGTRLPERVAAEVRHEASIMLKLQHDCLVRLLGLVQIESHPAMLVMEYGANGSLYNYLQSSQEIAWGLRLRIATELSRGLAYLHQEKVIHQDMKSLNVVLDRDFHAKWCDFGLAVLKLHSTTTTKQEGGRIAGTLRWMAPELFSRKTSAPSFASDIWALGMVFFELASREVPFKSAKDAEQIKDFIKEATGEDIPEACQQNCPAFGGIMQRCWQERTARPTAAMLVDELTQIAAFDSLASSKAVLKSGNNVDVTPSVNPFR